MSGQERDKWSRPPHRGRRLRRTAGIRAMVAETQLVAAQLVAPLFIVEGTSVRTPIASMPGHYRLSVDLAAREAADLAALGVGAVLLLAFPTQGRRWQRLG